MQRSERCHPAATASVFKLLKQQLLYSICLGLALGLLVIGLGGCNAVPGLGAGENSQSILVSDGAGSLPRDSATAPIPQQITVEELAQRIEAQDPSYWLIDVRTADEVAIATIPTSTHIPIAQITDGSAISRIQAEQDGRQIILHCYSGVRSRRAQKRLTEAGIATTDLKGGIKAWRKQVDPSLPKKLLP